MSAGAVLPEIKPCPFCGGRGSMCGRTVFGGLRLARVECILCGACGPEIEFRARADDAPQDEAEWRASEGWNRRDQVSRDGAYWLQPFEQQAPDATDAPGPA